VLFNDPENWGKIVLATCRKACARKKIKFKNVEAGRNQTRVLIEELKNVLTEETARLDLR
jgi:hypothetical protein